MRPASLNPAGRPAPALTGNLTGFTLLEIIVVMSLFVVLTMVTGDFIVQGLRSTIFGYEQDEAIKNARRATDQMVKEIREAAPSAAGNYIFDTVATNTIRFYSNVDSDSLTERVRYYVASSSLYRGVVEATGSPSYNYPDADETVSRVAQYINNGSDPIFTYYDTDNNLIADPATNKIDIRLIHLRLKVNVTPERAPQDFDVETDIMVRNLKDNL